MDGWVTIGFKGDSKQLEKDLRNSETQLQRYEKEAEKLATLKSKAEIDLQPYQEEIKLIKEAVEEEIKLAETQEEINSAKTFGNQAIEKANQKYSSQISKYNEINKKIQENVHNQELTNSKISELNTKLSAVKGFDFLKNKIKGMGNSLNDVSKNKLNDISKKINNVGKSVGNVTRKILKWGLALFGIRTAYNLIRQAVSNVTQNNEGLANQIDFMKNVIAASLEPLIKRIVSLVYTLLSFINSIVTKLTGKNLFEAAKKNMQSGSKSAKEIKKQLAGFDEMNVLSDSSSSQSGSGFDTDGFAEENSKLLDILNQFKEMIESGDWAGIAKTISQGIVDGLNWLSEKIKSIDWSGIGLKISEFLTNIDFNRILIALVIVFGEAVIAFQNLLLAIDWPTVLQNFGQGIANAIFKIDEYIKMIRWSDIGTMLSDMFIAIPWGSIGSSILTMLWDGLSGILDLFLSIDWGKVAKTIGDSVGNWIQTITKKFKETDWAKLGQDIIDAIFDFIQGVDWLNLAKNIMEGLATGILSFVTLVVSAFKELLKKILEFFGIHSPSTVFADMGTNIMKGLINGIKGLLNGVIDVFKTIVEKIKSVFSTIVNWIKNNVISPIINLFKVIGTTAGDVIGGAFKAVINAVLKTIETILNSPIKAINGLIKTINKVPGINLGKLDTFKLPRLAKGGIINQPGRGVMVGSAIAGERGAEGVIPLTDSQQMALLGEMIGRYVTINATINNNMNGRVISRELQRINNESDFAFNR